MGEQYVDRKRWAWALSPIWLCLPLGGMALASATGIAAWNWLTLAFWYLVLPIADYAIGSEAVSRPGMCRADGVEPRRPRGALR